jgi:predicted alpha/beta hydrolase family esterase
MKKQVVIVHGGDTFASYEEYLKFLRNFPINIERYKTDKDDWKPWLREKLGQNYEVILPTMPNKTNAQFEEWKLWFNKLIPFLNKEVILVGHSLGATFLAKYLSENDFPKKIKGVFLVGAVFDKDSEGYSLVNFALPNKLNLQTKNIYLYHSKDDPVVPFSALHKFEKALPAAHSRTFEDRKHLNQEEFPELLTDIQNLAN